jgi:DNA-binding transcriptional ArsR family regulator
MAEELRQVRLDARQIRVLAHPLRARLLGRLRLDGPATATKLAEALGTNTGATSYHLRQLADAGLVLEEDRPERGRERWWRAAHDVSSWQRTAYADDPDAAAAADWLSSYQLTTFVERAEAWQRAAPGESAAWRDAAAFSDYFLALSPAQLDELLKEIDAVIERHRRSASEASAPDAADASAPDAADASAPDARQVLIYVAGLPRVES